MAGKSVASTLLDAVRDIEELTTGFYGGDESGQKYWRAKAAEYRAVAERERTTSPTRKCPTCKHPVMVICALPPDYSGNGEDDGDDECKCADPNGCNH